MCGSKKLPNIYGPNVLIYSTHCADCSFGISIKEDYPLWGQAYNAKSFKKWNEYSKLKGFKPIKHHDNIIAESEKLIFTVDNHYA